MMAAEEIRKLNQRLDDLEARVPQKGKEAKA
jgi:tetrahydromethanopterin S-methyltransferase subunit G